MFPYQPTFFPICRRPLMTAKGSEAQLYVTVRTLGFHDSPRAVLTYPSGHLTLTDERRRFNLNLRPLCSAQDL